MWPSTGGRGRLGGATTDENLYPTGTAHGGPPTLNKPAAAGSGGALTPGNGAKAAARKALGLLGSGNASVLEDQARIKQQGLLGGAGGGGGGMGAKDVGGSGLSARPRRALGEITNRVGPPSSASKAGSGLGSAPTKPTAAAPASSSLGVGFGGKGSGLQQKMALPSAVPATALADLPSFSDDEEEVDDVELSAGRLGDDEDRLVAQKRAAKEAEEDAGFLRKMNRLLCSSRRGADEMGEEDDEDGMMMDAALEEDDAAAAAPLSPKERDGDDAASSLGSVLDDLDLLVDF